MTTLGIMALILTTLYIKTFNINALVIMALGIRTAIRTISNRQSGRYKDILNKGIQYK